MNIEMFILYLKSKGLKYKRVEESQNSFTATLDYDGNMNADKLLKSFSQINLFDIEFPVVRLSFKDIHNEKITGSFFREDKSFHIKYIKDSVVDGISLMGINEEEVLNKFRELRPASDIIQISNEELLHERIPENSER